MDSVPSLRTHCVVCHASCVARRAVRLAQAQPRRRFRSTKRRSTQLQQWMQSGRYTSRQLVDLYLARIEQIDRSGPALRSVIEVNPDALTIADALDAERKASGPRGPLHGIPVLIKDNIDTADRMMTTAGSLALEGSIAAQRRVRRRAAARRRRGDPRQDEPQRVGELPLDRIDRAAGAGAAARRRIPTRSIATRAGRARAPAPRSRPTWRRSASAPRPTARSSARRRVNGLVGIKPTVGLVSRSGIIPISHTQDTAGSDGAHGRGRGGAPDGDDRRRRARRGDEGVSRARRSTTRRAWTPARSRARGSAWRGSGTSATARPPTA